MNNTLKHWKEAATLILAAGVPHGNLIPQIQHSVQQAWQQNLKKNTFDYEVLLLQRSQKSGFMPNAFVFPGGLVDPSDFSNDWIKVFKRYEQKPNFGLGLVNQHPSNRSPMFVTDRTKFGSLIPGEVAFRICAIRETFEESGILLAVPENSDIEDKKNLVQIYDQDVEVLSKWRLEVQNNPFQFIQMCSEMQCVPNIWALQEWGNWLTPAIPQASGSRRYDTAFFICCLQNRPIVTDDQKEITTFKWCSPPEAIEEFKSHKIWMPPPQFYELNRLCNFSPILELQRFSINRALEGCERWMPVLVYCKDGILHTLPGDELYPEEPDWMGEKQNIISTNKTIEEIVQQGGHLHRHIHHDGVSTIFVNISPKYKHINPLTINNGKKSNL
ncbi:acyl-coenzyme A diphosphatase NUDT19 [Rhinophrynus dorsalis]